MATSTYQRKKRNFESVKSTKQELHPYFQNGVLLLNYQCIKYKAGIVTFKYTSLIGFHKDKKMKKNKPSAIKNILTEYLVFSYYYNPVFIF